MLSPKIFLASTTLLVLLSTLSHPVLAQSREANPGSNKTLPVERKTKVQSNAALLGTVEVGIEMNKKPALSRPPRAIEIEPVPKVRLTQGPPLPGEVGPAGDRGIQIRIDNP
jgi:hypothetical protein